MFYGVLALLTLIGKGTSKHTDALALIDQYFIKNGEFPFLMSRQLHNAFDLRQMATIERGWSWQKKTFRKCFKEPTTSCST